MNPLFVYFLGISFVASITVYFTRPRAELYLKLFPPFLLISLGIEILGFYYSSINKPNVFIYNFFSLFEFMFYFYVLASVIFKPAAKNVVKLTMLAYGLGTLINLLFIQGVHKFHTVTYAIGCLLIVGFCIYYFFELFRLPRSVKLQYNPAFWICSGLLFFFCCLFPLYGLFNLLVNISDLLIKNFFTIITIVNIFLYSLFTIGFLCRIRIRKYTL